LTQHLDADARRTIFGEHGGRIGCAAAMRAAARPNRSPLLPRTTRLKVIDAMPAPTRRPRDDEMDRYGLSHIGKVRKDNQDRFLMASINKRIEVVGSNLEPTARLPVGDQRIAYLAMVADGVGGGTGGAEASATALEAIMRYVDESMTVYYGAKANESEFAELLRSAALRAHDEVVARRTAQGFLGTMATTLTLYIGVWPIYYLLQVGDSRYYVMRDRVLSQVTRDQTMAQDLVDGGVLTRTAAARTPLANVLSSAIGADSTVPVVTKLTADWHNVHLLCSDGLTKHVSDERIAEVLGGMTSARQACEQLLQDALDGGGTDNITIVIGRAVPREPV
jgi:protein phosphatase